MKSRLSKLIAAILIMLIATMPLRAAEDWYVPSSVPTQVFERGDGSSENPYIISTAQQLANFSYMVYWCYDYYEGKYIALENDIVLNDNLLADQTGAKRWQVIGSWGTFKDGKFLGTFDGRGHTISGMFINYNYWYPVYSGYVGLFGTVKGNGVVKNVHVKDSYIDVNGDNDHSLYIGGIVGYTTDNAKVTGCSFEGEINGNYNHPYLGGIVGYHNSHQDISDCHFSGLLMGDDRVMSNTSPEYVGGIAGYSYSAITNCTAAVNTIPGDYYSGYCIGGIVGECRTNVVNCVTYGSDANGKPCTIVGYNCENVGGIAGKAGVVSHCRNYASVQSHYQNMKLGGVVGNCNTVEYSGNFGRVYCKDERVDIDVAYMGGVAGYAFRARNCANYGQIDVPDMNIVTSKQTVNGYCGGISGIAMTLEGGLNVGNVKASKLYYDGSICKDTNSYALCGFAGGISNTTRFLLTSATLGAPAGVDALRASLEELQSQTTIDSFSDCWSMQWGVDMDTKYPLPFKWGGVSRGFALEEVQGDGTEANPYIVCSVEIFNALNNGLKDSETNFSGLYFKQVCDLDFAGKEFSPLGLYYDAATKTYTIKSFKGHYDGGGYSVRNINYALDGDGCVGFIAKMEDEATLSNINFSNVHITASGICCAGIATGSFTTSSTAAHTPLSCINVLACSIIASDNAVAGGIAGLVATNAKSLDAPNLTIYGCTIQNSLIEASKIAGGLVGVSAYSNITHSTVMCDFRVNSSYKEPCFMGGLVGANGFTDDLYLYYPSTQFAARYCTILPTVDYEYFSDSNKEVYIGGILGTQEYKSYNEIGNSLVDFYLFDDVTLQVYTNACSGHTEDETTYKLSYVEFSDDSHDWRLFFYNPSDFLTADSEYKRFSELGGWSAYYINGNSNEGDMKWGYYYPTASPNPYPVTSANSRYSHYDLTGERSIAAPDRLYVDFTLSAVPLDNNVLIAADGAAISQMLIAAKANLVSKNGVASRLYLYDKMDFVYPGSFHSYAVHYENADADTWQVMCLPFELRQSMLPEGCKMFTVGGYADGAASGDEIEVAAAGEPFVLYNEGGFVIDDYAYNGGITGAATAGTYLTGTFTAATASAGGYVLSVDGTKFIRLTEDAPIDALRGYVPASKFAGGGDEVPFNAVITGIENVADNAHRTGIYADGEMIVIESSENGTAAIYSVAGALVKQISVTEDSRTAIPLAPGIYFVKLGTTTAKVIVG